MAQQVLSTGTFTAAKWIVSSDATQGTHTTIAAALTSASSGDTIFIRDGTYTENLTLKAGVTLTALNGDATTPNVTISGTCTFTAAGTVSIGSIRLQTNSAALLAVTGTAASIVNLDNCYLNMTNNTGITFSSSDSGAQINIKNSIADLGTTGIGYFSDSSTGTLDIEYCQFKNSGSSLTASTKSAGKLTIAHTTMGGILTYSSSNTVSSMTNSNAPISALNTTFLTTSGTGTFTVAESLIATGTASAISVGSGTIVVCNQSVINTSNANAITGAGTLQYSNVVFSGTSQNINTTTQTGGIAKGGTAQAPSTGFIGEQIRAYVQNPGTGLTSGTTIEITHVNLTAGIWDISSLVGYVSSATTSVTNARCSIFTTQSTLDTTLADNTISYQTAANVANQPSLSIPSYRVTLTATTTYYLNANATFTVGALSVYGRISATRVG